MENCTEIELVSYDEEFLLKSWEWLNDIEIKILTDTGNFTRESQRLWFESLHLKRDYLIWGVKCNNVPVGVFGIKHITINDGEYWGYIGDKRYWGKGIGKKVLSMLILKAKEELNLKTLHLHVIPQNKRAISLYNYFNFKIVETNSERIKMTLLL